MTSASGYEFTPRPWALAIFFCLSAVLIGVLAAVLGLSLIVVIIAPIGGTWAYSSSARAGLDRHGVRVGSHSCEWDDIELTRSRWGATLRSRDGVARKSRLRMFLPMYVENWEHHALRGDLRRWAPNLGIPR